MNGPAPQLAQRAVRIAMRRMLACSSRDLDTERRSGGVNASAIVCVNPLWR
jgi:hypothetical protein